MDKAEIQRRIKYEIEMEEELIRAGLTDLRIMIAMLEEDLRTAARALGFEI